MRLLIFSDVHGNLPATEIMLKDAGPVDGYICLGDLVDYGPWSNECVELVRSLPDLVLLEGNHDRYFINGRYDGTNPLTQAFFDTCYPAFTQQRKIKGLKRTYKAYGFIFSHDLKGRYVYPDSQPDLDGNYVVGHSHYQFKLKKSPYVLYNTGSVGQNRQYINVINYIILDSETMRFDLRSKRYDEQLIIKEMKKRGFPEICIQYYQNKPRLS